MIIIEDKVLDNNEKLKLIISKLDRLATYASQLSRTVTILQFSENYLGEGTLEDRKFVEQKIRQIQTLVSELDKVNLQFENADLSSPQEKQRWLKRAVVDIESIRESMLQLWKMKNSGDTPEDNKTIHNITKILFANTNNVIKRLKQYVDDFNAASYVKLVFRLKWTPLPK
jgi:hypothetical protein